VEFQVEPQARREPRAGAGQQAQTDAAGQQAQTDAAGQQAQVLLRKWEPPAAAQQVVQPLAALPAEAAMWQLPPKQWARQLAAREGPRLCEVLVQQRAQQQARAWHQRHGEAS
jgi:hypothetical protein